LNSLRPLPSTCNRWGWYIKLPTTAQLTAGISGPLYVGAGQNDISKAVQVGTWSAILTSSGVSVTYTLYTGYTLAEVHVDLVCSITTCAPGQYTYGNTNAAALGSTFTVSGLTLPSCRPFYLIIHAIIDTTTTSTSCPAPLAT
jgi:hypothetical protein